MLTLLHRIAVAQAVPDAVDNSFGDRDVIIGLAGRLAAENVQLFYQLGLNGRRDLPLAPDPRSGFEMVLLRMLAFKPAGITELPQGALQNTGAGVQPGTAAPQTAVATAAADAGAEVPQPVKKPEPVKQTPPAPAEPAPAAKPPVEHKGAPCADAAPKPEPEPPATARLAESAPEPTLDADDDAATAAVPLSLSELTPASWNSAFERLGFGGVVGNIASHCILDRIDGDTLYLLLDETNATLFNDSYTDRIQAHLAVALNAPLTVKISVQAISVETPAMMKQRLMAERRQAAVNDLQNDPNIQCLVNDFDAVLDTESVEPT